MRIPIYCMGVNFRGIQIFMDFIGIVSMKITIFYIMYIGDNVIRLCHENIKSQNFNSSNLITFTVHIYVRTST